MSFTEMEVGSLSNILVQVCDKANTKYGEIPASHLESVRWVLNGVGLAKLKCPSRSPAASKLLVGKRELKIIFRDAPRTDTGLSEMFQGSVEGRPGTPGEVQYAIPSLEHWFWKRPIENASLIYLNVEQFNIGWDLVNVGQTGTNMGLGFISSYAPSGILRYFEANLDEHPYIGDLLMQLSELDDGFDWELYVDPTGVRRWMPYYPQRGSHMTKIRFEWLDDGSIGIIDFKINEDTEGMATRAWNTGGTINGEKIEASYDDAAAGLAYSPRIQVFSSGSAVDNGYLTAGAERYVNIRNAPIVDFSITVKNRFLKTDGVTWDQYLGKFHCGDWVRVFIDDGQNQRAGEYRVAAIEWIAESDTLNIEFLKPEGF